VNRRAPADSDRAESDGTGTEPAEAGETRGQGDS
jgi:hypothetical protein